MRPSTWVLLLILFAAGAFRLTVIDRPFDFGAEGSSNAMNGVLARSYLRFAWQDTLGMPALSVRPVPGERPAFYRDHSPLIPLAIVPLYAVFGVGEWQTRAPTAACTIAAIWLLYAGLRRTQTERAALLSAALFAAAPMTLYFGGFPEVVGLPLLLGVTLAVFAYSEATLRPDRRRLVLLGMAIALACLVDWPAFLLIPILALHSVASRSYVRATVIIAVGASVFIGLYVYIAVATDARWNWMVPLLLRRHVTYSVGQWLVQALRYNVEFHTAPLLLASAGWVILALRGWRQGRPAELPVLLLLSWGLLHAVVGAKRTFDHEWWWTPLTVGIASSAGLFAECLLVAAETLAPRRLVNGAAVVLLAMFAGWTTATTCEHLRRDRTLHAATPEATGVAIRAAAPCPDDVALMVASESDAQLWFYGDRHLRTGIWTLSELEGLRRSDRTSLMFGFREQPYRVDAVGVVFPLEYRRQGAAVWAHLTARYPQVALPPEVGAHFAVFALTRTTGC